MATPGRFRIDPDDPRPLYVQIMDEVRRAMVGGALRPDDPMPSVRELAGELRLNPNTVQQAYRELEREGALYILRGRGSFVSPKVDRGALRSEVLRGLAERALQEAARARVSPEELQRAIREATQADRAEGEQVQSHQRSPGRDVDG